MGYADFKNFDECDFGFRNSKGKIKPAPSALFDGSARNDVDCPQPIRVADTHCHLGMLPNPALALARCAVRDVDFVCCITDPSEKPREDDEDSTRLTAAQTYDALPLWRAQAAKILDVWKVPDRELPQVRFAAGVHPHNARFWDQSRAELESLLARPETCCLGEIGLDYHYDFSPREVQRAVFAEQLGMAQDLGLPVSLHLREAHGEALDILRSEGLPDAGCILHCFNLSPDDLRPFLDLGCYIAFGGPLTFKKSDYVREAARLVPLDRLLTETDSPYMAPEPLRGTVCTPDMTVFTLAMLLDVISTEASVACEAEKSQNDSQPNTRFLDSAVFDGFARNDAELAAQIYRNAIDLLDGERL